jgi:hypothetical protein
MLRSSTRASHSSRIYGLLGVLLLSGCAAGCATADLDANEEGSEALQLQGGSGEASIVSISALGTGCPAGTAEITIDRDGLSAKVRYARFDVAVDTSTSVSVKDCQLAIALRDMEDYQYEVGSTLVGIAALAAEQSARILQFGYLQGSPGQADRASRELEGPLDDRFEVSAPSATVSTSCGPARDVNLRTTVRLDSGATKRAGHVSFSAARDADQTITVTPKRCR